MNVDELLIIIKKEKLDKHCSYKIGPPNGKPIAMNLFAGAESEGIYCDESGIWRYYCISDRGGVRESSTEYTETEACGKLLGKLRLEKDVDLHGW